MTVLRTFCGCSSLRTGSIIAGVAAILLAIVGIVLIFTMNLDLKMIIIVIPKWLARIVILINFVMTILISTLLLIGIVKRNMFLMLPWVVLGIMLVIGLLISVLYTSINFYIDGDSLNGTVWLVMGLISVVIYVYMWLVVYSFFQIVKEEYDTRAAYKQTPYRRTF